MRRDSAGVLQQTVRADDRQPLPVELAALLVEWLKGKAKAWQGFSRCPRRITRRKCSQAER